MPATNLNGHQTEISALAETGRYEWAYYREHKYSFPYPSERIGRCLGSCEHKDRAMIQYIMKGLGNVLLYQTFWRLSKEELNSPVELDKRAKFDSFM